MPRCVNEVAILLGGLLRELRIPQSNLGRNLYSVLWYLLVTIASTSQN